MKNKRSFVQCSDSLTCQTLWQLSRTRGREGRWERERELQKVCPCFSCNHLGPLNDDEQFTGFILPKILFSTWSGHLLTVFSRDENGRIFCVFDFSPSYFNFEPFLGDGQKCEDPFSKAWQHSRKKFPSLTTGCFCIGAYGTKLHS
jgi:hypothetical protein